MKLRGRAHKYGANVNTDVIIPGRYLHNPDLDELKNYCMCDLDQGFVKRVRPGDVLVATSNFGCGSAREQAPEVIKRCGISCVIAASFARIFYRNAINVGLLILESVPAAEATETGDELALDLTEGVISNVTRGRTFSAEPYPGFLLDIVAKGGLIPYTREKLRGTERTDLAPINRSNPNPRDSRV